MIRIEPLEKNLPKDWRRTVREHPWLSLTAAAVAGAYIGRHHGRQLLAAVVSSGLAFGVQSVRGALGLPSARAER
jgi:hypothetical protein